MAQKSVGEGLDRIELALSFQLGQAHGASNRHFAQIAAALSLTLKQVCALWLIADHPACRRSILATSSTWTVPRPWA